MKKCARSISQTISIYLLKPLENGWNFSRSSINSRPKSRRKYSWDVISKAPTGNVSYSFYTTLANNLKNLFFYISNNCIEMFAFYMLQIWDIDAGNKSQPG
jgi:hypothetical protein